MAGAVESVPENVKPHLLRSEQESRPVVLMIYRIAGAGEPFAKAVAATFPSFTCLSTEQIIHSRHGTYAVDYLVAKHHEYHIEADEILVSRFGRLLRDGKDVVLDESVVL